jgi:hypothetical protein
MRRTNAQESMQMQEFCQKLFDKVDPLGHDVTIVPHGEFIWCVKIENLYSCDQYTVEFNVHTQEWSWMRTVFV